MESDGRCKMEDVFLGIPINTHILELAVKDGWLWVKGQAYVKFCHNTHKYPYLLYGDWYAQVGRELQI